MKILALSDEIVPIIYSQSLAEKFRGVDLIVGCGDLPADYLEYTVSVLNVPLVYVPGNHDADEYDVPGGINIDAEVVTVAGIRVAGLGGSYRYKNKGRHQYTELEMRFRASRMMFPLLRDRYFRRRQLSLLVTHAPPLGVHDGGDLAHRGFQTYLDLLRIIKPSMMLHGHTHVNQNLDVTQSTIYESSVINVFPFRLIDLDTRVVVGVAEWASPS